MLLEIQFYMYSLNDTNDDTTQRYVIKELKLPGILYLIYIFTFKYKGYYMR